MAITFAVRFRQNCMHSCVARDNGICEEEEEVPVQAGNTRLANKHSEKETNVQRSERSAERIERRQSNRGEY